MDVSPSFFAQMLGRMTAVVRESNTLALVLILATVAVVMVLLVLYLLAWRNYLTNTREFFGRRIRDMVRDRALDGRDVMMVPVVHGRRTVIPLESGELLHFYMPCQYWFFHLGQRVRNVNIDLLFTGKESIKDFETIGRGRLFFTSRVLIFENIRSRNKVAWADVTEIKVKFDHLLLFDKEGCHAFAIENPELVCEFIYHVFLKDRA